MVEAIRKLVLITFLIISLPGISPGQAKNPTNPIHLKTGEITPAANAASWIDSISTSGASGQPVQAMIHFSSMPTREQREALAQNGITLLDYIPENTFTAIIRKTSNKLKTVDFPIHSIVNVVPESKADEYLWRKAAKDNGSIKVLLSVYQGTSRDDVRLFVASMGGQLLPGSMEHYGYYDVTIPAQKLRNLAGWYPVRYISPLTEPALLDKQSIPAVKGNGAISPFLWGGYGLNGDSVTIGVGDNTSGIYHTDTRDRIINFNPAQMTNHGIHINGIAGGAAILDPLAQSMTPNVTLVNFFFSAVLTATGAMLKDHNMTITNNSYTVVENDCAYFGTYDLYSRFLDTMALQFPTVQHIFAAGNDGENNCPPYPNSYGTMGGGYQPSKNTIVVGSVTNNLVPAWDLSKGPVKDGRLKPDLVAVGASVYSGLHSNTYGWAGGTSMASPQVASGMAILTQHYKRLHAGIQPRADLLKTVLMNAAMDLGTPGPDYCYGYGMMDVGRALSLLDNNQYYTGNINTGDSQTFNITIPPGIAMVKVMLYWHDIPASPSSSIQLINDLDLSVATPASVRHMPLVLDGAPANVLNAAMEKQDHLNNTEQVTIQNPSAGNYTITVKGHNIPYGPQHFVIAYDLLPKAFQLTFPLGGEQLSNTDSLRVFWNSVSDGNSFSVELSVDNGNNWIPVSSTIPAYAHYYSFMPVDINSGACKVRVSRNGTSEVATSQTFAISKKPVAALYDSQCPGYVNIHWSPIENATGYQLLRKTGAHLQVVDTVSDTSYSFSGMPLNEASIVAVQPILNGISGYRSLAVVRTAKDGDCLNPASIGDIMVEKILAPASGRLYTGTAPGASSPLTVQLRNLYTAPSVHYILSYKVNSAPWQAITDPGTISPNSSLVLDIPGLSFALPGTYTILVSVHNTAITDPNTANDTLSYTIKCLPNDPIDLAAPFNDDFENMPKLSVVHDSIGVSPNAHWDYFNEDDSGRLRSYVFDEATISGNRSISLDQFMPMRHGSKNLFAGTFNLSAYDTIADEVRVDFDYLLHGNPNKAGGNLVSARGNDGVVWTPFFSYDLTSYPGFVKRAQSLSLTDAVRFQKQNFSTSTQIAFGQNDSSLIAARNYGCGITIDNFRLYTVANDAVLAGIVSPQPNNCGLPGTMPLTIKVRNGVNYTLHNVKLYYRMDSGMIYTGSLDSIKAKDSVNYTFPQQLTIVTGINHKLDVWLTLAGDTYTLNDSIMGYSTRNSQVITNFPYLEDFETGNGGFYDGGFQSSWQYGTPASVKINKAASGTHAWKSNLAGRHNDLENSFLYSPCYDISQLNDPMLSFSMAEDIENCGGILCDGAYLQYSFDGVEWTKLGLPGQGYNWYDSAFYIWNTAGFTRWHVASIRLPKQPAGKVLHLRFVIFADPAVNFEGIAIDDIHIFDLKNPIHPAKATVSIIDDPNANMWKDYLTSGNVVASLKPTQSARNTTVTLYRQDTLSNPGQTQYTLPRSYTIKSDQSPGNLVRVQLYVEDSDIVAVVNDTTCPSCTRLTDAYSLGITQYNNDNNPAAENGTLSDDTGGSFLYHLHSSIQWVPYDKGYRAELNIPRYSEIWFNNGGPTGKFPAGVEYLNFLAFRSGEFAKTYWHALIDSAVASYIVQRSDSGIDFIDLKTLAATHNNPAEYSYTDSTDFNSLQTRYYRLKWNMIGSETPHYSPIRKVGTGDIQANLVLFNAAMTSSSSVLVSWRSYVDALVDHYILERAIDKGSYVLLNHRPASKTYGQQYFYTDVPADAGTGTLLHYKLTAVLEDGSKIELPVRTVNWVVQNAVTSIYPNPNHDGTFSIHWNADPGTEMQVSIMDITGKIMDEATAIATQWDNITTLQTARRPKGVYIIRMVIGGYRHTARMVYD